MRVSSQLDASNPVFFGDPDRSPPCAVLPVMITGFINVIFFGSGIVLLSCCCAGVLNIRINEQMKQEIRTQLQQRRDGFDVYDPLENVILKAGVRYAVVANMHSDILSDILSTFTEGEAESIRTKAQAGIQGITRSLTAQTVIFGVLSLAFVCSTPFFDTPVTKFLLLVISCSLFLCFAWTNIRRREVETMQEDLISFVMHTRSEKEGDGDIANQNLDLPQHQLSTSLLLRVIRWRNRARGTKAFNENVNMNMGHEDKHE